MTDNGTLNFKQKLLLDFDTPHPEDLDWLYKALPTIDLRQAATNPHDIPGNLALKFLVENLNRALGLGTGSTEISAENIKFSSESPVVAYCSQIEDGVEFFGVRFKRAKNLAGSPAASIITGDGAFQNNV